MSEDEVTRQFSPRPLNSRLRTVNVGVIFVKPTPCAEQPSANGVTRNEREKVPPHVAVTTSLAGGNNFYRESQALTTTKGEEVNSAVNSTSMAESRGKIDSISSEDDFECRICQIGGEERLISPCKCAGSAKWVHEGCLVKWFRVSGTSKCELCSQNITIKKSIKPLRQWRCPSVSVIGGPCQKVDIWYVFLTLFSLGTITGFAIFQVQIKANDAQTLGVFAVIYILCGVMIIARIRHFYLWFVNRSFFWQKWKTLNEEWTLTHKGTICETV